MKYNEEVILDPNVPSVKVGMNGNNISIWDWADEVVLSDKEAIKLYHVIKEHFNL